MSVRALDLVWLHSRHSGTELLMLLALADWSDDHGNSYPSVSRLAAKCRMSPRNAGYLIKALQQSGELEVKLNAGPKGPKGNTNLYRIAVKALVNSEPVVGVQLAAGVQRTSGVQSAAGVQSSVARGAPHFRNGVQPIAANTSLNRQDTSEKTTSSSAGLPACPHRQLIALFVNKVPELPKPRAEMWAGSKGAEAMAARWKFVLTAEREDGTRYATTAAEAIEWFGRFFDRVAESDFLTGRNGRGGSFDLQWLMKADNFRKVVEGKYENRMTA